jgi:hypothetical protein
VGSYAAFARSLLIRRSPVSDAPDNVQPKPNLPDVPVRPDRAPEADPAGDAPGDPPAEDLTLPTE